MWSFSYSFFYLDTPSKCVFNPHPKQIFNPSLEWAEKQYLTRIGRTSAPKFDTYLKGQYTYIWLVFEWAEKKLYLTRIERSSTAIFDMCWKGQHTTIWHRLERAVHQYLTRSRRSNTLIFDTYKKGQYTNIWHVLEGAANQL